MSPQTKNTKPPLSFANTTSLISSVFSDEFWNRLLLQAIHHEPPVRHAVIAFGALHERFTQHDTSPSQNSEREENNNFALSQYVKAVRSVLELIRARMKISSRHNAHDLYPFHLLRDSPRQHSNAPNRADPGTRIISEVSSHGALASLAHLTSPSNPYTPTFSSHLLPKPTF
jgi:hypothetical protein